ncbi:uncharacterized protein LOC133193351 [Saccostrea echinata]|uniref:uncharacterized protein LOC133193351 n=1 Tax=Saccostrea echinata TaxID=191078 RepID=UPI002A7F6E35|nr:uncharacterized protein LOC133193351 [Saccostrea echinata]
MKSVVALLFLVTLLGLTCSEYSKRKGDYYPKSDYKKGGHHYSTDDGSYYQGGGFNGGQLGGYYGGQLGGHYGGQLGGYYGGQLGGYHGGQLGGHYGGQLGGYHGGQTLPGGGVCPAIACYVPACQVESCPNFPYARCVGFCNGCIARFFDQWGRDVTNFCGRHHKKHKRY